MHIKTAISCPPPAIAWDIFSFEILKKTFTFDRKVSCKIVKREPDEEVGSKSVSKVNVFVF